MIIGKVLKPVIVFSALQVICTPDISGLETDVQSNRPD